VIAELTNRLERRGYAHELLARAGGLDSNAGRGQFIQPSHDPSTAAQRMTLTRRRFAYLAGAAVASLAAPRIARAQAYPARPVRLIVGFPAGGAADITARLMGQWLSERLGQPFVIENRPGAGSNIATEMVVRAPPDGYTLLLVGANNAISATLYDKLNFNFLRDITAVASIIRGPNVMVVNPSVPAKTVPEFIAYAKANPGKINMASPGIGTSPHVAGELFKMMAGIDMVHVPYRSPPLSDLIAGQVQVYFGTTPASIEYIRAGNVRALAVTGHKRTPLLPDLPTVAEAGLPGYFVTGYFGVLAPAGTPPAIIGRLNAEIIKALRAPDVQSTLAAEGAEAAGGSAERGCVHPPKLRFRALSAAVVGCSA
jgi:tripartite-type tricarboxylate transporter receptor subunit TctC